MVAYDYKEGKNISRQKKKRKREKRKKNWPALRGEKKVQRQME